MHVLKGLIVYVLRSILEISKVDHSPANIWTQRSHVALKLKLIKIIGTEQNLLKNMILSSPNPSKLKTIIDWTTIIECPSQLKLQINMPANW